MSDIIAYILNINESIISTLKNEILKLFINENTRFTHLCVPSQFYYQIHLIHGAELCFSELKFLRCYTDHSNEDILIGLSKTNKSIENLEFHIDRHDNNSGIVKLIEVQKNLYNIQFIHHTQKEDGGDNSFHKSLE